MLPLLLTITWLVIAGATLFWGLEYYVLPLQERAFSPLAPIFSPTGTVGHGLGIIGTALLVVGVVGYTVRKRIRWLRRAGALKHWLQVHIFLCTLGPYLVLLHTTFKFGGLVSVAFWSMAVVVASGIFGRYVYARIPKTINGRFLELEAVTDRARALTERIAHNVGLAPEEARAFAAPSVERGPGKRSSLTALGLALREDLAGRVRHRRLARLLRDRDVPRPARSELLARIRERDRLHQQTLLLRPFQRLFRYWHVVHLPLATVMFLILGVHVTVSILFGYTWIF